jgi:hypothetical protein
MTTLNTIISSMEQTINETVIEELTAFGFSHSDAVKTVVESDFDIIASAELYPVEQF